ncbi:unnamed protein product [Chrysoparadoxa australica]
MKGLEVDTGAAAPTHRQIMSGTVLNIGSPRAAQRMGDLIPHFDDNEEGGSGTHDRLAKLLQDKRSMEVARMPLGALPVQWNNVTFDGTSRAVPDHVNLMLELILSKGIMVKKFARNYPYKPQTRRLMLASSPAQILLARPNQLVINRNLKHINVTDIEQLQLGSAMTLPRTQVFERSSNHVTCGDCTLALLGKGNTRSLDLEMPSMLDRDELANALALFIDRSRPRIASPSQGGDVKRASRAAWAQVQGSDTAARKHLSFAAGPLSPTPGYAQGECMTDVESTPIDKSPRDEPTGAKGVRLFFPDTPDDKG